MRLGLRDMNGLTRKLCAGVTAITIFGALAFGLYQINENRKPENKPPTCSADSWTGCSAYDPDGDLTRITIFAGHYREVLKEFRPLPGTMDRYSFDYRRSLNLGIEHKGMPLEIEAEDSEGHISRAHTSRLFE